MSSANGSTNGQRPAGPPSFEQARNRRQKVRAAGMNPDYWYAVEHDDRVSKGQVVEVRFWGRSVALFRGSDGQLRAIDNRCAHRQLRLSEGNVEGCKVICPYHGWVYDGEGRLVDVPHDLFDKPLPKIKLASYPVRVRYGLIWVFFGDPALAEQRAIPDIPELEGPDRWSCVPVDFTWRAHHSMIIDNVSDFTHAYLHRRYKPFSDAKLVKLDSDEDRVQVAYDTKVGRGRFSQLFVDRKAVDTNYMELCYEYPYQWSNTDGKIKHWCFVLPIDRTTTRAFFLFYFKQLKVPLLPLTIPRWLMTPLLQAANRVLVGPLLGEDGWAVEEEQRAYNAHYDAPIAELNPAVHAFQKLTIAKWEEHLARGRQPSSPRRGAARSQRPTPR